MNCHIYIYLLTSIVGVLIESGWGSRPLVPFWLKREHATPGILSSPPSTFYRSGSPLAKMAWSFRRCASLARVFSLPAVASSTGLVDANNRRAWCMTPHIGNQLVPKLCGSRCLFPAYDPQCSMSCGRPAGHNRAQLCACPQHILDRGAPPSKEPRRSNFSDVAAEMKTKGFNPEQARKMWHQHRPRSVHPG